MRAFFLTSFTTGVFCGLFAFVVDISTNGLPIATVIGLAFAAGFVGSFVGQFITGISDKDK